MCSCVPWRDRKFIFYHASHYNKGISHEVLKKMMALCEWKCCIWWYLSQTISCDTSTLGHRAVARWCSRVWIMQTFKNKNECLIYFFFNPFPLVKVYESCWLRQESRGILWREFQAKILAATAVTPLWLSVVRGSLRWAGEAVKVNLEKKRFHNIVTERLKLKY